MSRSGKQREKKNAFGATSPPFIDYLKEILRRYPDGGQILKELIQNADDAGASKTVFIYDERRYGARSVWSEALGKYQGPALYAFNDAAFTEEDWEGIQRAGRSIKQDDPTKVGRFGIGFNSVYHVTDLPCVFSSKHLAVFDPQKTMFDDEREGYRWSLEDEEDRKHLLEYTDQFKPFQDIVGLVCDCAWEKIISEQYFKGTLFRFPLRSEASEISDNLYDSLKVEQLFDSFIADAEISLLFLRNVTSISLMHIDTNGTDNVTMKVSVSSSSPLPQESEAHDFQREYVEGVTSFKTVCCVSPSEPETKTKWLVTTCLLMEGRVPEIDTLADKLSFHPQVDVAFQCDEIKTGVTGRLSCFLPLPNNETNNTGLPVNVNACFGLTDNRRYIKWQEEDQKNDESAMWNELLKKEVLPHVYLKIIQDAIQFSRKSMLPASTVYSLWPDLSKTEQRDRWHEVAMEVYKQLFTGKDIFSLAANEESWVAASEAVFPTNNTDTDTMSAVARLLIAERENLVTVPEHVLKAIQRAFTEPATLQWVTPCFVRTVLRKTEIGNVSKDDKLSLLEYVLSDGKYEELHGLQLLPLSDGSFRSFTNEEEDTALIDNEEFSRALLPFCKERFLCDDLNSNTIHRLRQMAMTNPDLYKIINLDMKNVASFAKEHLPRDWKETQGHVKWNYAKDGHPPKTWLTEFWKFLNAHWEELNEFIGMPLIPLEPLQKTGSSTLLAKLEKNPTLIFQSSRGSTLPDQVQKVVKIVGGTVIKKDECLKHHDVESYVLTTSPKNVLQVLLNTDSDKVVSCIASASLHEKEEFKTYISSMDCISHGENQLLSALPLFRLMSGKYVAVESRQAVILKSNPPIPTDLPVPETTVQCANEADRRLLILLKVDLLDAAQLAVHLVDCIERKVFNKEEEEKIMTWILHHGNVLLSQSEELLRKSRNLSFIETEHGERKQPSSVFDPTNKIFQDLFEEDFFLPQVYRTQVILQSLRQLGLRTKEEEISPTNVLHVVSQIQKLHIHSRNKAFKKADALVGVLNRNDLLSKFSEGERGDLLQMQWVPCENPNSVSSNSKNIQKRGLYKPAEIRASKYFAIVGHVMPLTSELRECVCQKLDLFIPPPAEKVLENLCVLGSMAPLLVNPDSDYEFKNKVHSTYKFIQENTEYFREEMSKKCITWLWCQNEFVSPRDVVLVYPDELDLSLYIKKVPEEFLQYADMLKEFGVKETLSDEEIEDIFHDIKQSIDDRDPPFGEPSELKVSIAILDWMRKNEKPLKNSTPVPVRAENQNFTLEPLKNTVYCDISDEGLEDLRQDKEEFHVIHEEVLGLTAKWLKVPFLSTRILKPQFIRAEEECPGIEQCGQTEPITQRIKNILKEYDEVSDIFKELIQNAEDAGASTCGFLLDFRTHPPESLIDDGMALCNGPCLWAFNNELFSDEDWKNIVRVGSASKENKIEKIGNFGLGFNAVYHLTDIPSILSGKSLLILDPNVTHLEKHIQSKANPGIKLDLFQERLFRRFPGQFRSYQGIFGCDLTKSSQKYYKGTLIKLPFRTSEEVCKSEISCKVYNKEDIHAFQQHFTDDAQSPLLFLKNMNSVSLQIISEGASIPPLETQIQTPLRISKEVVCSMNISNEMHVEDIRNTMENLDSNCHKVVDCFTAHIVQIVYEHVDRISNQYWLIYSCLGTKDSMRMFHRELQECKFSLPIGGVAVPLQKEAENVWSPDESCAVGQAFCFLPLPIDTGLPVHLNGSFAVTSNRKALWQTGTKLEWNKSLLQDASATAYITTLLELKKMAQHGNLQNYDCYTFWPDAKKVSKAFQPLVSAFYSAIAQCTTDRSLDLFSNGQSWCSIDKARFLDPEIERNEAVGKLAIKVFLNDTESHYCAVPLPLWVRNSFIQCGFHEVVEERTFHWVEFYQVVFKNLKNMDPHCRNALILNAIDLNDHGVDALLKSNPCIPTQKSDKLQFISKLVNPLGKVACLYDPEEGRFLDGTKNDYFTPRRIQRLSGLGMLSDTLMLEDVVERAKTISRVWTEDQKKVQKCLQCLFACMNEHLYDDRSPHWETLEHISFLPARIIDQDNNLTIRLKKPSEVYSYQYCDLVNMTEFSVDHSNLIIQPNNPVLTKLGVNKTPPVKTVLKQLKEAHDRSDTFEKSLLLNVAKSCYNYLNKYLIDGGDPTAIIDHAQSIPFVLIEGHFVSVGSVAKSGGFEEKPYLYVLPAILSQFENLWNCVGIKNKFTAEQFVAVLQEMSTFPGPLSKSDLHTCLSIVIKGLYDAKVKLGDCLLPDEKGVLTHASKLHYNDSPWMPVQAGVKLCHKLLPRPVACHFGVVTTRHHTLKNHLVDGFCPFTREFGQHEKLTVRIKNIIDAYPSKKDILKELIQNADDAEATEIHFVWDKRQHKTEKIFGEKWKLLQGPALCVYNNKTFTDEDLIGIQQLGEGGKHGTLGRTGKFGLGFNSVYHLTDCPSILTADEKLCVSDPNLKYVESGTKESPGCMYLMDDKFKESFKDVYHTFLPEKFALQSGTMFRFPLRTEKMTKKSEISRHAVTDHEMNELLYALIVDPEGLILFLKHITKLQFHVINADGSEQNVFLIEKKVTESTQEKREGFHNHVHNSLKSGQLIPCQTMYNVLISSGRRQSLWIIAERYGSNLQRLEKRGSLSNLKVPQVALAACVSMKPEEAKFTGRAFCSLPLPGKTGLPVHVNGNFEVDFSRRDLWKEDAESLRTTWNESLKLQTIAPLYADLLSHLCTNCKKDKPNSLVSLKQQLDCCFKYFPFVSKDVDQSWHEMISEVYRSINQQNFPVIPTLRSVANDHSHLSNPKYIVKWSSVSKPDPLDLPYFMPDSYDHMLQVLEHTGMNLVPYFWQMEKVKHSFKNAGVTVAEVSPLSVINYLKKKTLNDPSQTANDLPLPVSQTLIKDARRCSKLLKFCLSDVETSSSVDLNGLPLLLTEDQTLRKFSSDSPRLISRFTNIFLGCESEFADFQVNRGHVKILQKGKYIKKLTIPVAAMLLKPVLQRWLQKSVPNQRNGLYRAEEETITWLRKLWEFFDEQAKEESKNEKNNQVFSEIKKHFFDSPILPVICPSQKNTHFLQTISNLHSVIYDRREHISAILLKLGFMVLNHVFFKDVVFLYRCIESELLEVRDTSAVLEQLCHVPHSQFEVLSGSEADALQHCFQSGISLSRNTDQYQRMFMSLPLFETIFGKRQRIDLHRNVFVLKTEFQARFPDLYIFDERNVIFLKYSLVNEHLSENLDIQILGDLKYCVQFMLPSVDKFTKTQLLNLVRLLVELRQNFDYGQYRDKIASTLRCVRFIEDIHGCLQMASYFFDDTVNLYKVMLPKERFVPEAFWKKIQNASDGAKSLLKDLGLKHEVSEEEIIGFAHQIESDSRGKTDLDVLKHRSSTLFKFVLQRGAEKNSKLMHRIATITFIFPVQIESELCVYHKAFAQGRDVVAIKGSLLEKDLDYQCLIWTAMPMLPSIDCSPRHIDALTHAGAFDKPPSEKVMQHLNNICKSLCSTKTLVGIRAKVFTIAYAYLQSVDFDASVLAGLPLILTEDDTNLVKASQAVLSLTNPNDFRPYLYPIQGKHAMYAEFFKKIGVEEKPTITQLCTVLQEIHTECCNKTTLQPNQQATVKRAVQQLFCLIQEDSKGATFPKITLYLPSTDGKLYESSTLFFNDTFFQAKRLEDSLKTKLKLLEKLNHCHLGNDHYEHQKLMKLLPQKICPKLLSQVISEHLVHAQVERCDYRKECEFSGWFENHLSSYAFRHGLICLIREQSNGTVSQTDAAQMCEITFGKIQISCCKALQTELLLDQEPLEGTQTETQVYVQKQQGGCTFYLKHNDSMAPKVVNEVTMHLTKEINSLLQNILNSLSLPVLGQLLLCENMEDVERALEQNGIHNSVSEGEGFGARPSPGSPIPEEWHDSLDMSPLNSFEKGEYVGFRKDESKSEYVFAIIVERLDELPGGTRRNPPRYKIQIGSDEFTEVSALDLYQFKREARAGSDEFIEVSSPDLHQFRRAARSASMTNDTCTEMDIMPKPATASQKRPIPKTLEEVKREIDQSLKEIWNMPPEDKCKALRRLYLRWHPDKNLDNPDLANEAFKYLKNKINELQQGKTKCSTFSSSNDFRDYWSRWNEEARSHRRGRERFYQNNSRQYYNFWSYYRETPRPNREEAKRWYKQAQFDLNAAQSETTGKGSPEWCLFKVHQAVEKALIATEYRRSGRHSGNCSIASLAQQVSCYSTHFRGIPSAVAQLSALGVDAKKTQYPNYHPSPHIPHEQFTFEDARKAVNIATELLTKLCKYITD
ncbi:sacsin [Pygocentrus nattereri]|uniref:HEPN domain-containing protein n=1 Tax=Pygocentrus nattereri TaxID=42514 RepID=A0A3B4DRI0_PYGNA|nr:sacsin [Pygocentrus nattereri]